MAEIDDRYVKRGHWININGGSVMGGTITTDVQTGTFIVALLAMLSSVGISHFWNLINFACHQYRADGRKADALYWQQQALLRSQLPPTSFLADWIKLWWIWRKKAKRASVRSALYVPLSILFISSIIAVGIFSSFIIDSTNLQVLAHNPQCGYLDLGKIGDLISDVKRDIYLRSESYADECYVNSTDLPVRCKVFLRPNLPLIPHPVECPFSQEVCLKSSLGVSIDSGIVNANDIVGWNLDHRDQVKFRRKATCGMVKTREFSEIINASDYPYPVNGREPLPGEQLFVGRYWRTNNSENPRIWQNVTFSNSLLQAKTIEQYTRGVQQIFLNKDRKEVNATIHPGLALNNADLALVNVRSNQVRYVKPVDDPLFAAHQPADGGSYWLNESVILYSSDLPASTIGCMQQYQYCIPGSNKSDICTPLTGLPRFDAKHEELKGASKTQLFAIQLLIDANFLYDSSDASRLFKASKMLDQGYRDPVPDDQWIREVVGWESSIWAAYQYALTDYAVGYTRNEKLQPFIRKPLRPEERKLCGAQRMRKSGGFMNINVFGLAFVTGFSCVLTLLDLILLKFVIFLQSFRKTFSPRIDRWIQDGVFQLQRRAFESQGQGAWTFDEKEIPITVHITDLDELRRMPSGKECKCTFDI